MLSQVENLQLERDFFQVAAALSRPSLSLVSQKHWKIKAVKVTLTTSPIVCNWSKINSGLVLYSLIHHMI
uniref:Uncharacterized protein n=1 Tax=Arion vulgaris TaxID=1028688 RepID=A0A0B7BE46_9EUPU